MDTKEIIKHNKIIKSNELTLTHKEISLGKEFHALMELIKMKYKKGCPSKKLNTLKFQLCTDTHPHQQTERGAYNPHL